MLFARSAGMSDHAADQRPARLLDRVRAAIRLRHYSPKTEEAYVSWIRRFVLFHGKRHPREMGAAEVTAFLSDLAVTRRSSASTQNQALSAVLFLYGVVLGQQLPWLDTIVRAQRPVRLPVVLSRAEVTALLATDPLTTRRLRAHRVASLGLHARAPRSKAAPHHARPALQSP